MYKKKEMSLTKEKDIAKKMKKLPTPWVEYGCVCVCWQAKGCEQKENKEEQECEE